jgi:hypothetical protein
MHDRYQHPAFAKVLLAALYLAVSGCACAGSEGTEERRTNPTASDDRGPKIVRAHPGNYRDLLRRLRPGDTLLLSPGVYDNDYGPPGLAIFDLHGEPNRPIVITGPATGPRPIFKARPTHNTVRIANASFIVIRNLDLDGRNLPVDGVKAQGPSHDITVESLMIRNHGHDQQNVGISTKAPAWNWVVRGNVIERAGTGMYFGHPDGLWPFVHALIEHNLVVDTIGYNIQIKHQKSRTNDPGLPQTIGATVIRHNVFIKKSNAAAGSDARPNLLVGHFPLQGPGSTDVYQIYGNVFYQNESGECLFQGEGNIALYNNLFVNNHGDAVCVQPHNDMPRMVRIFYNTILARDQGIRVVRGDRGNTQLVTGNAVFAGKPIEAPSARANISDSLAAAANYLIDPSAPLGMLNLAPKPRTLGGPTIDQTLFDMLPDATRDFEGIRRSGSTRGAYAVEGANPRWLPTLDIKPSVLVPPG